MSTKQNNATPKRQPRKLDRSSPPSRQESTGGGVPLPTSTQSSNGENVATTPRRRRPKKLNSEADIPTTNPNNKIKNPVINVEVEALKSRVRGIETQVQELLQRPQQTADKSKTPRRRQRGQKSAEAEEKEEMESLQSKLETAKGDLVNLHKRAQQAESERKMIEEEEDVEEIPRIRGPGLERTRSAPPGRQVTLSGSYRIPLPTNVDEVDLFAIQRGIASAQNVARTFLDARRASGDEGFRSQGREGASGSGSSWGSWFGGYSMSIVRAVDKLQLASSLETTEPTSAPRRQAIGPERANNTTNRRRPPKLEHRGSSNSSISSAKTRPALRTSNSTSGFMSDTQVAGLLA